jgi:hypothetical protein
MTLFSMRYRPQLELSIEVAYTQHMQYMAAM